MEENERIGREEERTKDVVERRSPALYLQFPLDYWQFLFSGHQVTQVDEISLSPVAPRLLSEKC